MIRGAATALLVGAAIGTSCISFVPASAYASDRDAVPANEGAPMIGATSRPSGDDDPGNPLWAVPLNALSATRERPLFSASRRPPPPTPPPAVVEAPQAAPPPAPSAPAPPPFLLVGAIISPQAQIALIKDAATQTILRVREGDEVAGWRVRSVAPRSIVVERADQSFTLDLPRPSGASGAAQPPPPLDELPERQPPDEPLGGR